MTLNSVILGKIVASWVPTGSTVFVLAKFGFVRLYIDIFFGIFLVHQGTCIRLKKRLKFYLLGNLTPSLQIKSYQSTKLN